MGPADLAAVDAAADGAGGAGFGDLLGLLRACLVHRFGSEVAIGGTARAPAGDHDISVSRRDQGDA